MTSNLSILVVEDEVIVANDIRETLLSFGYQVAGMAKSGEAALEKVAETNPDLVLMDIRLTGTMDGIDTAREIHRLTDIPVIYLTVFTDKVLLERAKLTEPYGYLIKPYDERELQSVIEMARYKYILDKKLKESEERHRLLADNATDVIWTMNIEGRFTYVSPSVEKLRGYTVTEVMQQSLYEALTPESAAIAQSGLGEVFEAVQSGRYFLDFRAELEQYCKDGSTVWTEVTTSSMRNASGEFIGILGVTRDITERKQAEKALQQANRQLNLITSITRHDILNKITLILGYLGIAEMKSTDPALGEYFRKLESATNAIQSQIMFTRIYKDLGTHKPQWQKLNTILPRSHIPATITFTADVQGIEVFIDPMLEKVFFNLLDNSVRHGQHVTEIMVSGRKSGEWLAIVWEDNGVGIVADEKEKIFERGFGKNTGLGLFLVREILSLAGITITETGVPGNGARFEIMVPKGMYQFSERETQRDK